MKKFLFFCATLVAATSGKTQHQSRLSAELLFGGSLPVGNFASKSPNYLYVSNHAVAAGWAMPGPAAQISLNYQLKKSFGLRFLVAGQQNKQDPAALENDVKRSLNTNDDFVVSTNSWKIFRVMVGGYYELPIVTGKVFVVPTVLVGILKTAIPAHQFYDTTTFSFAGNADEVSLPIAFCFEVGAGVKWEFSKSFFLSTNFDFYHAEYKGYSIQTSNNQTEHVDSKIPISSINLLAGIGYKF